MLPGVNPNMDIYIVRMIEHPFTCLGIMGCWEITNRPISCVFDIFSLWCQNLQHICVTISHQGQGCFRYYKLFVLPLYRRVVIILLFSALLSLK